MARYFCTYSAKYVALFRQVCIIEYMATMYRLSNYIVNDKTVCRFRLVKINRTNGVMKWAVA